MKDICGKNTEIIYTDKVKGDVKHTAADNTKAKELLDYQAEVEFEEGLRREVEWLKEIYLSDVSS